MQTVGAAPDHPDGARWPALPLADATVLRRVQRVAMALATEPDEDRLLDLVVSQCRELTGADAASLYLVEAEPTRGRDAPPQLRYAVAQNDSVPAPLVRTRLPVDRQSLVGYVALTQRPLNLADVYALPPGVEYAFNPVVDRRLGYRTVSALVVPMTDPTGEVLGVLQLLNKKRRRDARLDSPAAALREAIPFDARDEELVMILANLTAVAVRSRRVEEARARLEAELRQAQKMEAVGRLAGGVAHDFNNLLVVIRGRTELLLHHLPAESPVRRQIELIREAAERAAALTQRLLTFSRKRAVTTRAVDLNELVGGMAEMLRRLIGEHIELVVVPAEGLWLAEADPAQVEQIVLNLAVNARDAMPDGGRLTIETRNAELDEAFVGTHPGARVGPHVALSVRDTGVGMDAETRAHLFEPFFTTKGPGRGTGLGLATVYGIVKQHRGYVTVESAPGEGALFTVYLPRARETATAPAYGGEAPSPAVRGSETVLLVEDDVRVRELVREFLRQQGYVVLEARNGVEALRLAEAHPGAVDLLLTDVVMPGMGGPELARRLTAARPETRVLYMSGYVGDATPPGGLDLGRRLLHKPFTGAELARRVREALDGPPPGRPHG